MDEFTGCRNPMHHFLHHNRAYTSLMNKGFLR